MSIAIFEDKEVSSESRVWSLSSRFSTSVFATAMATKANRITKQVLEDNYHLPMAEVAKKMGVPMPKGSEREVSRPRTLIRRGCLVARMR